MTSKKPSAKFSELVRYYDENKHKPWNEWLTYDCSFDKQGKQGLVGLFKTKHITGKMVFKVPQDINYLAEHEGCVLEGLNDLHDYCPNFCRLIGTIKCDVDPDKRKKGNPFARKSKYKVTKDVLLIEYVEGSCKLATYLRSQKAEEDTLFAQVKQVLMATAIAQRFKSFSHYDLHSSNIMLKKCNRDLVFLYVLDEENQFAVPTHGQYPVIIDPGFAYIEDLDDGPMWMSLGHTDGGLMSDRFDWVADPKLFLVTISGEFRETMGGKRADKLRRVVKNIFSPLSISWFSGHDKPEDKSSQRPAADYLMKMLQSFGDYSKLFREKGHFCIDMLQSLVVMPLEEQSFSKIDVYWKAFLTEWVKIENEVTNQFFTLYILKGVTDAARRVGAAYRNKSTKAGALMDFKHLLWERMDSVVKFCRPKNFKPEVLLCSLIALSKCIEGVLYGLMEARMEEKQREYDKLPLDSIEQIYGAVEANVGENYKYSANTHVCVMDCVNKTTKLIQVPENHVDTLNEVHYMATGSVLYGLYNNPTSP